MEATTPRVRVPFRHLGFLAAYGLVAVTFTAQFIAGSAPWLTAVVGFGLVPALDLVLGRDLQNVDATEERGLSAKRYYSLLLWIWAPLELVLFLYVARRFALGEADLFARVAAVTSVGITTGALGINIAHELGHRSGVIDKVCTKILFGLVCYLHFTIEHNRGHHLRVATPADPATARLGEGFWAFLVRTVPGQYLSAWHLENERLRRRGKPALHVENRMIWYSVTPLVIAAIFYAWLGPIAVVFYFSQAVIAVGLLEAVNYIEHYGLLRRELSPGVYERVTPMHSWNASWPFSNWILFGLQRHADHHASAGRRYQILRHLDGAPQLPAGYPTLIPLALFPPLWRLVMDKRAIEARKAAGTWHEGG